MSNNAIMDWARARQQQSGYAVGYQRCQLDQPLGLAPQALESFTEHVRKTCQCNQCAAYRSNKHNAQLIPCDLGGGRLGYWLDTRPREMTAADLGLSEIGIPTSDAPYSFWLGSDQ